MMSALGAVSAKGRPLEEPRLDHNFAGIKNLNNYTGYTYDYVLDLYFAQNRFYNPDTRQFITQDPIKDGMNWYVYCDANPLTRVDWLGLKPVSIRSYVESRGGEVSRLYYDDFFNAVSVTFILNNRAISVTMSGENSHELTVKNVGDSLFAHDYDLQNFFYHGNTGTNTATVNNKPTTGGTTIWIPSQMNINGETEQEKYLSGRLSNFAKVPWDQDKMNSLWETCEEMYRQYGIQVDPRFLLAIIIQEGTGSFNTSSTNRAADGQHGVETNFILDLMKANNLIFGKFLGYIYYGEEFNNAVQANFDLCDSDAGSIFGYANWGTPIIDFNNNSVRVGVYAGHSEWWKGVKSIYERLTYSGAANDYSEYLRNVERQAVEVIVGGSLPSYNFVAEKNGQNHLGVANGTWTIVAQKGDY